ncbi:MAG: DUF2800 domain-containing protein [Vicinamibacterales bacterium]
MSDFGTPWVDHAKEAQKERNALMRGFLDKVAEAPHSNFIGGSNCAARIACPASYGMELKLPESVRKETTVYADEGSACHAAVAHALNNDVDAEDLLGMVFEPYTAFPITRDLLDEAVAPCIQYFDNLVTAGEADGGLRYFIEKRVAIPFIPGAFGTADVVARTDSYSIVGDWKFGVGVGVYAPYDEEHGTLSPNEQLMFYVLGALHSCPEMFENRRDWPIKIFIGQPRFRDDPHFDQITLTRYDIERFEQRLRWAADAAKGENPPMAKGPHCRFMACKSICPLHTGPLFDIGAIEKAVTRAQLEAAVDGGEGIEGGGAAIDWGLTYARMLDLANHIEPVVRKWREQAQAYLEAGDKIPGWKLVDKRAARKWSKLDRLVDRKLQRMGLSVNQRRPRVLISPPQAEKLLKPLGKTLPEGFFEALSSGTTLAQADDPRRAIEPVSDVIAALTTALSVLGAARKP